MQYDPTVSSFCLKQFFSNKAYVIENLSKQLSLNRETKHIIVEKRATSEHHFYIVIYRNLKDHGYIQVRIERESSKMKGRNSVISVIVLQYTFQVVVVSPDFLSWC